MVAEAPPAEAGRMRLKTRIIENRAGNSILLFFIAIPPSSTLLYLPYPSIEAGHALVLPSPKEKGLPRLRFAMALGYQRKN
jgi:hypothetical protein